MPKISKVPKVPKVPKISSTERMKRWREQLKHNDVKWAQFCEKEAKRKREYRRKKDAILLLDVEKLRKQREIERNRQRRYREKKKFMLKEVKTLLNSQPNSCNIETTLKPQDLEKIEAILPSNKELKILIIEKLYEKYVIPNKNIKKESLN